MGGPYSVRGFKSEGSLSGNIGAYVRNELSLVYKTDWGNISPYAGLDFGVVKHNSASNGGKIMGAALGVRANIKGFSLDVFVTRPLYNSNADKVSPVDGNKHNNSRKFFGMSLSYQF
jgi:hemolysin activation/secretion protein